MNVRLSQSPLILGLLLVALATPQLQAEVIKLEVTKDACISSVGKEGMTNMGKAPRLKLKGYQEYCFFDFDVKALAKKKINSASLHVAPEKGVKYGGKRGTDLRWFTVSSVGSPWNEGLGTNYSLDLDGAGVSFDQAKSGKSDWAHPGSKSWDVILGNGHSLRCDVDAGHPKDGWLSIPVDVKLIQALVAGASHGLMLMDGSVFISTNAFIYSREGGKAPFLTIVCEGEDGKAPSKPDAIQVVPCPMEAGLAHGAARISLKVPADAFAFHVKVNGVELPRWQIPFAAKAGMTQTIDLAYLESEAELKVEIAAVDSSGNRSAFAAATGKASAAVSVPRLPRNNWLPKGGHPPLLTKKLKVWAFPEISKLDPLTAEVTLERNMEDAPFRNSIWDAGNSTVRLAVARGEIAGFQLALEALDGSADGIKVKIEGLQGVTAKLWRTWFVNIKGKWQGDYAIPMKADEGLTIPAKDNKVPDQRAAVIAIDLIVSKDAKPGKLTGNINIEAPGGSLKLPLQLNIYPVVIPDETNFIPELNCYRGPGKGAGSKEFFDAFRIAHYHRCSINRVPHSHSGRTHTDWIPAVGPDGHVTDWTEFDKNLGPLLDGSAFKGNPRDGVPVPVLYLPFNESWPLPIGKFYAPGKDVVLVGKNWKPKHDIWAKPPEEAFPAVYKDAFVACVKDFVKHFEEKGWNRTLAQAYNNNKYGYGKHIKKDSNGNVVLDDKGKPVRIPGMTGTAWTLDEPQSLLDWQALKFYSNLFHKGITDAKSVKFVYRGDISRPMWQGSYMDGLMEVMVAGGGQFSMLPLMKASKKRMPTKLWAYGGCNSQDKPNHQSTLWCLKAYVHHADGILPWQSLGGDESFDTGDRPGGGNALIVDGSKRFSVNAIASFRIHALRRGAQLAELLLLLEKKKNWTRSHSAALVSQKLPLSASFSQAFADDAAPVTFQDVNGDAFEKLKEGLLIMLSGK